MIKNLFERRLPLFPRTTKLLDDGGSSRLTIAGCDLVELVERYGTPLYLFDRQTMDTAVQSYRSALERYYPGESRITYAGKAYLCKAIAQWAHKQDLWIDCTGIGEIHVAVSAGVPRDQILVHGVNKSQADLEMAVERAGVVVIDNLMELERLLDIYHDSPAPFPDLWLRLRPGLPVDTHSYTQTGQADSKFGMDFHEAGTAIETLLYNKLPLRGIHFHQGSHFHDPAPVGAGLQTVIGFLSQVYSKTGWHPEVVCPGGGWAVAYHEDDLPQPEIERYVGHLAQNLLESCNRYKLPLPILQVEPGRSLIAQAGVSLYRIGAVKNTPNRRWIMIDGGMADNPRPALYNARYSALPVLNPGRAAAGNAWIAGPFCESGDILIENLELPDLAVGEYLSIPVSGAYHLSMGSNYNGARKPAVIVLENGKATLIQERETLDQLTQRDHPLS